MPRAAAARRASGEPLVGPRTAGTIAVAALGIVVAALTYGLSRRNPVNARNVNDVPVAQPAGAAETASA